eukprot:scaffold39343_cov17-Tisochrysis_lutea.AAC.1
MSKRLHRRKPSVVHASAFVDHVRTWEYLHVYYYVAYVVLKSKRGSMPSSHMTASHKQLPLRTKMKVPLFAGLRAGCSLFGFQLSVQLRVVYSSTSPP